jgi:hypothetical protein
MSRFDVRIPGFHMPAKENAIRDCSPISIFFPLPGDQYQAQPAHELR